MHLAFVSDQRVSQGKRHDVNVVGTSKVLGWARHHGAKRVCVLSRAAVYGARPDNPSLITEDMPLKLGAAWSETAVLVVSEFGRTVAPNGTGGTDHGTAGVALLAGGAVAGGRVQADWPGLNASALQDGRDLRPTLDLRGVFKGVLRDHLGVRQGPLSDTVFPGSGAVRALDGLIRS